MDYYERSPKKLKTTNIWILGQLMVYMYNRLSFYLIVIGIIFCLSKFIDKVVLRKFIVWMKQMK